MRAHMDDAILLTIIKTRNFKSTASDLSTKICIPTNVVVQQLAPCARVINLVRGYQNGFEYI